MIKVRFTVCFSFFTRSTFHDGKKLMYPAELLYPLIPPKQKLSSWYSRSIYKEKFMHTNSIIIRPDDLLKETDFRALTHKASFGDSVWKIYKRSTLTAWTRLLIIQVLRFSFSNSIFFCKIF